MGKHFDLTIGDGQFRFARRSEAIRQEADLDGLYVIRTSEPQAQLPTAQAVRSYKAQPFQGVSLSLEQLGG
jgi:hypothetical protein